MPVPQKPAHKIIEITPMHLKGAKSLFFNSIITEFNDSYTPRWTPTNVYGRMDPMSNYAGTDRSLTLGFRVISDDRLEAAENMGNIQKLIQYQYPTYTTVSKVPVLAAPPYFRFKFLNVIGGTRQYLEGYINGAIEINPGFQAKDQAQYFSSNLDQLGSDTKLLFSNVNIVLRIQVLHEGLVGAMVNGGDFQDGRGRKNTNTSYPYGVISAGTQLPPAAQGQGTSTPGPDPSANKNTTSGVKGKNAPKNIKAKKSAAAHKNRNKKLWKMSADQLAAQSTLYAQLGGDFDDAAKLAEKAHQAKKEEENEKFQSTVKSIFENDGVNEF